MRINGQPGKRKNTCKPRKRLSPSGPELKLQMRIEGYNWVIRNLRGGGVGPDPRSYKRPGSLKAF